MAHTVELNITDPGFRRARTVNWVNLGLLYALFYMSRYNFMASVTDLSNTFGWSKADIGVFETVMPLVYGIAVVVNGPIADRIGGKKAFLIGTVGAILANFAFGCGAFFIAKEAVWAGTGIDRHVVAPAEFAHGFDSRTFLIYLATAWGINGYFQSFGALSIVKVNAHWFHVRERGTFAGIFGILIRFGLVLGTSVAPAMIGVFGGWQYAFWVPSALLVVLFVTNYLYMHNSPSDAGFEELDTGDATDDGPGGVSVGDILKKVFVNPVTLTIALASMMIGLVRRSVLDGAWMPKYFGELFNVDRSTGTWHLAFWLAAAAGIAGGFVFGIASDRVYKGRRAPVVVFGFLGMAVALVLFSAVHAAGVGVAATVAVMIVLSFFVNGAHGMIGGAASMDFGGKKAAATAAGLFDGMQYVASAIIGPTVPLLVKHWGWAAWIAAPIPFALIGAAVMARLWNATPGKKGH
ncbi:MAG: MFS transporter [Deltaproteobacteria bacterium]|nr:MFS transporter [Deltaproteobacteria bacterium]